MTIFGLGYKTRLGLNIFFGTVVLCIYTPIFVMVIFSFNSGRYQTLPFREFTTDWYARMLLDQNFIDGLGNSLIIAILVSISATILGFLAAYAFQRAEFPAKSVALGLLLAPLAFPLILVGIGMRLQATSLGLQPGLWLVAMGQTIYVLPLAVLNLRVGIANVPKSLEDAAISLGASRIRALTEIMAPACRSTIIATLLITFTFAFDEFIIAYFLTNFEITLPIKIWTTLVTGFDPTVNAVGSAVFIFSVTLGIVAQILLFKRQSGKLS